MWRYARATRVHVVIDAAAYFDVMCDAMLSARQQILMIGWDFDTRIKLGRGRRWWNPLKRKSRFPSRLGAFVVWLVKRRRDLQVRVLKWNFGALKFLFRGRMMLDMARWWRTDGIEFKLDGAHPFGCSHHQKIVVIDDRVAVCGGIDMTSERWDRPEHIEHDPERKAPGGKPYGPWHDVTMMVEGEAAEALGELGRDRWRRAGGSVMKPCIPQDQTPWPDYVDAEFRDVDVGIARTSAAYRDYDEVREIEALFLEQIARSKRFIYAESQYFASRKIGEAIALRLSAPEPPEIVLVQPVTAHGWLEQLAMDAARVRLLHAIAARDPARRLRMFVPYAAKGTPIYIHAKLMIVDDEILRIGSANMNNRSLGLDSECDLFIDTTRPGNEHARPAITRLRHALIAEHCALSVAEVAAMLERHGSMAAMIDAAPRTGNRLEPFALRPLTDVEKGLADQAFLDPERPEELFEPIGKRHGLFTRGGILRRPR